MSVQVIAIRDKDWEVPVVPVEMFPFEDHGQRVLLSTVSNAHDLKTVNSSGAGPARPGGAFL